jgi:hypothetical protein
MSDPTLSTTSEPTSESEHSSTGMLIVRYGIGGIMVLGGIVMLILSPAGLGVDGFAMAVGGGLSVLLLNFMYRLSVSSELDREREEQARAYFDEHGDWPEDDPTEPRHKWVLPAGAVSFEQELAQQSADDSIKDRSYVPAHGVSGARVPAVPIAQSRGLVRGVSQCL